jgi:phospholipid/cholesterol/gamma-HCH transport system ATP-binding protein
VSDACSIADYIYLIGDGSILAQGTPEEMQKTNSIQVRQFMDGLPDGPVPYHYPAADYIDDLLQGNSQ